MSKHTVAFYYGAPHLILGSPSYREDGTLIGADVINGAWFLRFDGADTATVHRHKDDPRELNRFKVEDFTVKIIECEGDPFVHWWKGGN